MIASWLLGGWPKGKQPEPQAKTQKLKGSMTVKFTDFPSLHAAICRAHDRVEQTERNNPTWETEKLMEFRVDTGDNVVVEYCFTATDK